MEVSRAVRRRSVSARSLVAIDVAGELDAVDGERGLVEQRVEQAALGRGQQRPGQVLADAGHAQLAAAGAQGEEQAGCAGEVVRAAAGGRVVAPAPFRRGEVVGVELVLGRVGGQHRELAVLGQQEHDLGLQHDGHLVGGGPEQVVDRGDAVQLPGEGVEGRRARRLLARDQRLGAGARGDAAGQGRHGREQDQAGHVLRVADVQGVERVEKEEIVAQDREQGRRQRRAEPPGQGGGQHRHDEDQGDIGEVEQILDQPADAGGHGHHRRGDRDRAAAWAAARVRAAARAWAGRSRRPRAAQDDDVVGTADQVARQRAASASRASPSGARCR